MDSTTSTCGQASSTPTCVGFMDRALGMERAGHRVIHMEKGELDFDTPEAIRRSAVAALDAGHTRYCDSRGLPQLREAISAYYARTYGVEVPPARVLVTSGSSPGLLAVMLAIAGPGRDVVLFDPGYPAYRTVVELAGARSVLAPTVGDGYRPTVRGLRGVADTEAAAVVVNSPSNPTGSVVPAGELAGLAASDLTVVADETYEALVFDGAARASVLQHDGDAVVVGSFSKSFAMTGWRLGYVIAPEGLVDRLTRIVQDSYVAANTFVQWAAVTALEHAEEVHGGWRATLLERRDALLAGLRELGFEVVAAPEGAFYVFARLPEAHPDCASFALRLLDETGVAITPGREFGPSGAGHLRFSYSTSVEAIREGLERLDSFLTSSTDQTEEVRHGV